MGRRRAKPNQRAGFGRRQSKRSAPTVRDQHGRLHLLLHQDPVSGATQLALKAPLFTESWQDDVALSTASTAYGALRSALNRDAVVVLTRHVMDATSRLADGFIGRAANGTVACKPGCDHCCHQSVGVTPAEALTIVEHLQRTLSSEALQVRTTELAAARERTRGLSSQQRFSPEHPCPFLRSAQCTIYEVRPLSCRGMNSLDANECRTSLRDPESRAAFLQTGRSGQAFMEPIRAFHAVSAGLQLGIAELFHLDMRPLDLTAAVHELLSRGPAAIAGWLAGESSLEPARGGDSTRSVSVELTGALDAHTTDANDPTK